MKLEKIAKGTNIDGYVTRLPTWGIVDDNGQVVRVRGRLSGLPVLALYDRKVTAARDMHNLTPERIISDASL